MQSFVENQIFPLSQVCAHLLIIFKCNHLPFCLTSFQSDSGSMGLSVCKILKCVIMRQMKYFVFACFKVGCRAFHTSVDC